MPKNKGGGGGAKGGKGAKGGDGGGDTQKQTKGGTSVKNYCKRWHADLVEINSRAESDFLITKVHKIGGNYWIGATDKNRENNFKWVTSGNSLRNTFSHWCRNEPDDGRHHVKDCVLLKEHCGHKWSDDQCSDQRHFICEMTI